MPLYGGQGLAVLATTGVSGFALQNATPSILTWTAPNDGGLHRVFLVLDLNVTVVETGGALQWAYTNPAAAAQTITIFAAGQGTGAKRFFDGAVVQAGTAVVVSQNTALTAGTASVYAELWGL